MTRRGWIKEHEEKSKMDEAAKRQDAAKPDYVGSV